MDSPAAATAGSGRHLAAVPDAGGLFAKYSAQILAYCVHHLGSRSDAEDALQTTFLQAHRALQRGVVPECESAWLTAIAKNACRWQRRTRGRRAIASETELDLEALPAPADDERRGTVADLREALASIPERQRWALLLREWQGLQPSEIAPRLGASTSETYALLARARRSVASSLTAAAHRPVLGLDFGSLLLQLRSLLTGAPAAVGVTAVAIAGVAGLTVERAATDHHHTAKTTDADVVHASAPERGVGRVSPTSHGVRRRATHDVASARRGSAPVSLSRPTRSLVRPVPHPTTVPRPHVGSPAPAAPAPTAVTTATSPAASATQPEPSSPRAPAPSPTVPAAPPVADPGLPLPLPVDPSQPGSAVVTTVTSTATGLLPTPDPPAPAPSPPPAQLPPVGGLLP